ncbi:uncharacterized protein LOC109726214 [Ananas comosus]|uniref:Uncharacterized protein LOC109726214 n=1 Tax=Ananas comosus TaxID=4615 RepID=A0A6P5GZV6_ANACO|nr:uncharacterized protein LOC109726214 [Ananas comosus]
MENVVDLFFCVVKMASRRMSLSVHWDGQLDMDGNGPRYFGGRKKLIAIRSDTTYANFERRMYRLVNCNREECCLKYTIRCPTGANEYIAHDIVDDESLEGLIGLFEHYGCVSLYIEKDLYPSETQYQSQGYYTSLLHNDIDVGFPENPIGDREVDNEQGVRMTRQSQSPRAQPSTSRAQPSTSRAEPSTSRAQPSTSRVQPWTSRAEPSTSRAQPSTSRAQPSMSRDEPRIFHTPNENYDWGLSTPYTNWNEVLDNIVDEGDDNDGNQDDELIHNDGHQEDAPIDNDGNQDEDDDWNDLAVDIEDDHDGGLNCLANAIYSLNDDPHVNNDYVDNPDEELDFIDHPEQFPMDNNWIQQYVVNSSEFDVRRNNSDLPSIDGTWLREVFNDKASLVDALDRWHITHNVQMKVVKSTKTTYTVKCTVEGCPWRLHASVPKDATYFRVKTYAGQHTCVIPMLNAAHRNCTSNLICQLILPLMKARLNMTPKEVQETVRSTLHVQINYWKAWLARSKALQIIYGSWEQSYTDVPRYLTMLQSTNHGTYWRLDHRWPSEGICQFGRLFWSFAPSIHGFAHCRPVVSIDATHLYGKYEGHALIATAVDANDSIFPLAFAICEGENGGTWRWFLHNLGHYVIRNRPVCFISDRFSGLKEIVAELYPTRQGHAHRWCLRHMKANMAKRFKNESLLDKFYSIGSAPTSVEYYKLKDELRALDEDAWKWVDELEVYKEYWAWAFDGGRRFGLMTTNMSESLNGVLKGIRALPVTAFVAGTFYKLNSYFVKRRENGESMTATLAPKIQSRITMNMVTARGHIVYRFGTIEFEVQTGYSDYNVTINGTEADCNCGEFKLTGIPCSHILAVCSNSQLRIDYHSLCSHWYTVECYRQTYAPLFHPVPDRRYWPRPMGPPIVPPPVRRKKGRPRSTRIRNIMDATSGRRTKCSICKQHGHYRNTCPQNTESAQQGRRRRTCYLTY